MENYDYSAGGWFFITICVAGRENLLRDIDPVKVKINNFPPLSEYGKTVDLEIQNLSKIYSDVLIDKYCIMPDHIHMIIHIAPSENTPELSRIVRQFKGAITKKIGKSIWQKNYYDHIIRNKNDYNETCKYIYDNPLHWEFDFLAK